MQVRPALFGRITVASSSLKQDNAAPIIKFSPNFPHLGRLSDYERIMAVGQGEVFWLSAEANGLVSQLQIYFYLPPD